MSLTLLALAACGAAERRVKPGAWVHVVLMTGGNAQVELYAAGRLTSDPEVREVAEGIARDLFPGAAGVRARTELERGLPVAQADVAGAYRPGNAVSLRLDTGAVWRRLAGKRFTEAAVRLWLPAVPSRVRAGPGAAPPIGERAWRLRGDGPTPVVEVEMRPQVARWGAALLLPLLGALGVGVAFFGRRRGLAAGGALGAVAAAFLTVAWSAGRQGDNLGVAGVLSGKALEWASMVPLAALPLAIPALMILAALVFRRRWAAHPEGAPRETGAFW